MTERDVDGREITPAGTVGRGDLDDAGLLAWALAHAPAGCADTADGLAKRVTLDEGDDEGEGGQ